METIDIITMVFFGLGALSVALGIWAVIAFTNTTDEDPVPLDDMPCQCEDYERVFYNP